MKKRGGGEMGGEGGGGVDTGGEEAMFGARRLES